MKFPTLGKSPLIRFGLAYFVLSFGVTMLAYVLVQQNYRTNANDPQIQLAEDGVRALRAGTAPEQVASNVPVDVTKSLSPIVIVYNASRGVQVMNGSFGAAIPVPPMGTFDYALAHGSDRFTWEPAPGLRLAAVLASTGGTHPSYVLAARNLREVEIREVQAQNMAAAVLGVLVVVGLVLLVIIK